MSRVDVKIVLLGHVNVGKTSLVARYVHDHFNDNSYENTIGAAFAAKQVQSRGKNITIGIWDTAGSERYEAMSRIYYRGAKAAVVCYDICNQASWDRAKFWISELHRQEETCKVYLCGTKLDLCSAGQRQVMSQRAVKYSEGIQATYVETSSKTGENVSALFQKIADDYLSDPDNMKKVEETVTLSYVKPRKGRCCTS